jgi:hypothetical protein
MSRNSFKKVLSESFPACVIDEAMDAAAGMEKVETF